MEEEEGAQGGWEKAGQPGRASLRGWPLSRVWKEVREPSQEMPGEEYSERSSRCKGHGAGQEPVSEAQLASWCHGRQQILRTSPLPHFRDEKAEMQRIFIIFVHMLCCRYINVSDYSDSNIPHGGC